MRKFDIYLTMRIRGKLSKNAVVGYVHSTVIGGKGGVDLIAHTKFKEKIIVTLTPKITKRTS